MNYLRLVGLSAIFAATGNVLVNAAAMAIAVPAEAPAFVAGFIAEKAIKKEAVLTAGLLRAAQNGNLSLEFVEYCAIHGVPLDSKDVTGTTLLMHAARIGNTDVLRYIMEHTVNPADTIQAVNTKDGQTAFALAVENGHLEAAKYIFDVAVRINKRVRKIAVDFVNLPDKNGNTPIMCAMNKKDLGMIEWLLSKEVNLRHKNALGQTALTIARDCGDPGFIVAVQAIQRRLKMPNKYVLKAKQQENPENALLISRL